ncbi:hypothetical protein TA3x_001433 [Tundrisphaera sp. TA3]|uniref:hypothetical protein n=1 Tax=Tundrisphaera sp. TA3 TaxID=3435775 RepID=UPI003EBA40F3
MGQQYDPDRLIEIIREGSERYGEVDDHFYVDYARGCGQAGLRKLAEIINGQIDEADESIAVYGAILIIRLHLPGRVAVIREILNLPFRYPGVRDEVWGFILDNAKEIREFLEDEEFIAAVRRLETGSGWVNRVIAEFLEESEKRRK